MPSLSDSSATRRPATPCAVDPAYELARSDSVNRAACVAPCLQPHSMRPIGAPRQGGHAGTQSALALLARSAALVLAVQQQRQHSSQPGSKRRRDEAGEPAPHPCKRQASQAAEPTMSATSLM